MTSIVTILESYNKPDYELESPSSLTSRRPPIFKTKWMSPWKVNSKVTLRTELPQLLTPIAKPRSNFQSCSRAKLSMALWCHYPFGIEVAGVGSRRPISYLLPARAWRWIQVDSSASQKCTMRIYDRWGNVMFHSSDAARLESYPGGSGVYTYVIEFEDIVGPQYNTGDITVSEGKLSLLIGKIHTLTSTRGAHPVAFSQR